MADRVDTAMTELLLLGYMETVVKDGKIGYKVTETGKKVLARQEYLRTHPEEDTGA